MPLKKEIINFPLARGRDGGSEPQMVEKLREAQNIEQTARGALNKRSGYSATDIPSALPYNLLRDSGGGLLSNQQESGELVARQFFSKSASADSRTIDFGAQNLNVRTFPLQTSTKILDPVDIAIDEVNNEFIVAYEDAATGDVTATVYSLETMTSLGPSKTISVGLGIPMFRCFSNPDNTNPLHFIWVDSATNLPKRTYFDRSTSSWSANITIFTSNVILNGQFDIQYRNGLVLFVYQSQTAKLRARTYTASSWAQISGIDVETYTNTSGFVELMTLAKRDLGETLGDDDTAYLIYTNEQVLKIVALTLGTLAAGTPTTLLDLSGVSNALGWDILTATEAGTTTGADENVHVWTQYNSSVTPSIGSPYTGHHFAYYQINSSLTVVDSATITNDDADDQIGGAPILGDIAGAGVVYLPYVKYDTYYLLTSTSFHPCLNLFQGITKDEAINETTQTVRTSAGKIYTLVSVDSSFAESELFLLEITPEYSLPFVQTEEQILIGGTSLRLVDGGEMIPPDTLHVPQVIQQSSIIVGSIGDGTRLYVYIYKFIDSTGRIWRSAPSLPFSSTVSSGPEGRRLLISPRAFEYTSELVDSGTLVTSLYRTENGGTQYYLVDEITSGDTIDDTLSDADLIDNEALYTTGGILENYPPPSFALLANYKNRVLGVPMDSRNTVWYSKQRTESVGVEFSALQTIRIPQASLITALQEMDDVSFVFEQQRVYAFHGEGPNNLGQGGFSLPRKIASDVGCVDWRTMVLLPVGIMFKSLQGWYILDRSLQMQYIGHEVKDYDSTDVRKVLLTEDRNVRCYLTDGTVLIYDYEHRAWYIWDNHTNVIDAIEVDGEGYWISRDTSSGTIYNPDSSFTTDSTSYNILVETGWFSFGGIAGFQRLWEVLLQGTWKSSHTVKVTVFYDYDDSDNQAYTLALTSDTTPYILRIKPDKQRCNAIKIRIEDDVLAGTEESFSLTGIKLKIGVQEKTPVASGQELT